MTSINETISQELRDAWKEIDKLKKENENLKLKLIQAYKTMYQIKLIIDKEENNPV